MKGKLLVAISILLVMYFTCNVTAYATIEDSATVATVTYTKTEAQTETESPNLPLYEISIPSQISIDESSTLVITLKSNNLAENQMLYVLVDADTTIAEDGFLYLEGTQGQEPAKVTMGYYSKSGKPIKIGNSGVYEVASFKSGDNHPASNGTMFFNIIDEDSLIADTYAGRVYFTLRVITE